jgi:hypothetical protein
MNIQHLEEPAQRLVVAVDMLAEMIKTGQTERAAYLASALKGDAEVLRDFVQILARAA